MSAFPETMRVRTMSRPETGRHSMLPSDAAVDAFRERLSNFAPQGTMMSPAALMSPSVNARAPGPARTNPANPLGGGGMPTVQQPSRVIASQAPFTGGYTGNRLGRDERSPSARTPKSPRRPKKAGISLGAVALWALVAVVVAMSTSVRTVTIVRGDGVRASEKAAKLLAERVSVVGDSVDAMAAALDARGPSTAKRDRETAALRKDLDTLVKQVKAQDATIAKVKKQRGGGGAERAAAAPAEVVDHGKDIAALRREVEKLAKQKAPTPAPAPAEVGKAELLELRRELLKEIAGVASQAAAAQVNNGAPEVPERVTAELDELRKRLDALASIPYPVPDESKADKTDIEDLRREIGKLANEAKGTRRHSKTSKEVADEVRAQMELFRADRTGLVDYAMFSGGGKVVGHSALASAVAKGDGPLTNALKGLRGGVHPRADEWVISASSEAAGECLALEGTRGWVDLRLREAIVVKAVTVEHVHRDVAYDITSAPKSVKILGWNNTKSPGAGARVLGSIRYQLLDGQGGSAMQTFELGGAPGTAVDHVRFEVESNYGNKDWTCLYRLRVHGKPSVPPSEPIWD